RFGNGMYTSKTSSKAARYSHNGQPSKYKVMLLNNVAVGKTYQTQALILSVSFGLISEQVCGLPGTALNFDETCVYNDDAMRPTYLILYNA
ncbi:hypothetical protein FB45DRAFT_751103, partial [Roridomyces roridus]